MDQSVMAPNHKKKKKVTEFSQKFVEEVSCMGLSEAIKSKTWFMRIVWTIIFIGCFTIAAYFVYQVLAEYWSNPTATKVEIIQADKYHFPPLILCVDTWLKAKKMKQLGLSKEAMDFALLYLVGPYDIGRIRPSSNSSTAEQEFLTVYRNFNFTSLIDFFQFLSLDSTRMDIREWDDDDRPYVQDHITFTGIGPMDNEFPKRIVDRELCYLIRLEPQPGHIRQSYGWHEITIRVPDLSEDTLTQKDYWKLYVDPVMSKLVAAVPFISIQTGHTHTITMSLEKYKLLNKPKEPCKNRTDSNYSALTCALDCSYVETKKEGVSNCSVFNLDDDRGRDPSEYCNSYYWDSWYSDPAMEHTNYSWTELENCTAACIVECDPYKYETFVDIHKSKNLVAPANGSNQNLTMAKMFFVNGDLLANGIVIFNEVYTYSFETLVGNIGGTCGIWIGASVMTFMQLVHFCTKHCVGNGMQKISKVRKLAHRREDDEETV